jgi:hypothetical protein
LLQLRLNDEEIDKLREEMHQLEEKLNELTHGEFYGPYALRGLEAFKVKEIQLLVLKYPDIRDVLGECILKHREFYEKYFGRPLTDKEFFRNDVSVQNILALQRNFPEPFSLANYAKTIKP